MGQVIGLGRARGGVEGSYALPSGPCRRGGRRKGGEATRVGMSPARESDGVGVNESSCCTLVTLITNKSLSLRREGLAPGSQDVSGQRQVPRMHSGRGGSGSSSLSSNFPTMVKTPSF